ncbi:598_t:CDS:2, partial [Racocetra persica]
MARSPVRSHRSYETTYFESPANTILAYHHQPFKVRSVCENTVTSYQNFFRKLLSLKMDDQLECALDLMRRLPPQNTEENLSQLISLVPPLHEDLVNAIDQPLKVATCPITKKEYLQSSFNRDGDSFRSPWSNEYDPPFESGMLPSPKTRKLEIAANDAFNTYRE